MASPVIFFGCTVVRAVEAELPPPALQRCTSRKTKAPIEVLSRSRKPSASPLPRWPKRKLSASRTSCGSSQLRQRTSVCIKAKTVWAHEKDGTVCSRSTADMRQPSKSIRKSSSVATRGSSTSGPKSSKSKDMEKLQFQVLRSTSKTLVAFSSSSCITPRAFGKSPKSASMTRPPRSAVTQPAWGLEVFVAVTSSMLPRTLAQYK
mmetsp:Transcript_123695/g.395774  ORF Transcript_123695/g.395774 Transcript_123695/m.395774 type:complete len:205 (+) Transcript_123695:485-1099(+)